MKKKLIALAVASTFAMPMLAHAEAPTVYGKLHLSYGSVEEKSAGTTTVDNWQFRSHASRVGVKGEHDLGNGLAATYKLEWEVDPDSDNSGGSFEVDEVGTGLDINGDGSIANFTAEDTGSAGFSRRNQYAGLKGSWGEVRFGRHDTPLKMAQGKFDLFGDTDADLKHAGSHDGENRIDNVLMYLGKSGNIKYTIAVAPSEGDGTTDGDGPADTISASIAYEDGPLYVALAQDSYDDTGAAASTENSLTRLVGTYKMGNMQVGLLWQSGVEKVAASADEEDWLGVSFSSKFGANNKFKAQYITTEDNAASKTEGTLMAVGVDHKFNKKTTGYLMYSNLEFEQAGVTEESSFLGTGLVVKF